MGTKKSTSPNGRVIKGIFVYLFLRDTAPHPVKETAASFEHLSLYGHKHEDIIGRIPNYLRCQMLSAYSVTARSAEKIPAPAMLLSDILAHLSLSL